MKIIQAANLIRLKAEWLLILFLSTASGRLSPLQTVSKTGIRPPAFGLVEMEPLGSIGELRFQEILPHGLPLEGVPLSGCRKVALRLEDGGKSHVARGGQPLLEPHSVRGGSSQRKQVLDIEHLIGTVQKMAEDALDGKEGAGREEIAAEVEIETFVQGIADGMILGVDWEGVQEMLGEDKQRLHLCSLHPNIPSFPSPAEREHSFTEEEIMEILRRGVPHWMKESYEKGELFDPISVRYFAAVEPESEGWLGVPGATEN